MSSRPGGKSSSSSSAAAAGVPKKKKMTLEEELEAAIAAEMALQGGAAAPEKKKKSKLPWEEEKPRRRKHEDEPSYMNAEEHAAPPPPRKSAAPSSSSSSSKHNPPQVSLPPQMSLPPPKPSSSKPAPVQQAAPPPPKPAAPKPAAAPPPAPVAPAPREEEEDEYNEDFDDDFEDIPEDELNEPPPPPPPAQIQQKPVIKSYAPPPPAPAAQDDEYGDEYANDFEDYADDFDAFEDAAPEEEEPAPLPPPQRREVTPPSRAKKPAVVSVKHPADDTDYDPSAIGSPGSIIRARFPTGPSKDTQPVQRRQVEEYLDMPEQRKIVMVSSTSSRPEDVLRRQETLGVRLQRFRDLRRLINLEISMPIDLLDMPPKTLYELYVRNLGVSHLMQTAVQCGHDNPRAEAQTEPVASTDAVMQFPEDLNRGPGAERGSAEALIKFLRGSAPVIEAVLQENLADGMWEREKTTGKREVAATEFSSSAIRFAAPRHFGTRRVVDVAFSPSFPHICLVAYSAAAEGTYDPTAPQGLVLLWSATEPQRPTKYLISEGEVTCCGLSPGGSTVAFAGSKDGSLVLWDLKELAMMHASDIVDDQIVPLRRPTFSTDGIYDDSHNQPISRVIAVPLSDRVFQVATIDENQLKIWAVLDTIRDEAVPGMAIGGKIYAARATSVDLYAPDSDIAFSSASLARTVDVGSDGDFVVGCDFGLLHLNRHGNPKAPRYFDAVAGITSLHVCPHMRSLFLVGTHSGAVYLFSFVARAPLFSWEGLGSSAISSVRWAGSGGSAAFFALEQNGTLHAFDLAKNHTSPLLSTRIDGRPTCIDTSALKAKLVVGRDDGTVEIHSLSEKIAAKSAPQAQQQIFLASLLMRSTRA